MDDWENVDGAPNGTEKLEFMSVWKHAHERYEKKLRDAFDNHSMHYNYMDPPLTNDLKHSTMVSRPVNGARGKKPKVTKAFEDDPLTILAAALCDLAAMQTVPKPRTDGGVADAAKAASELNKKFSKLGQAHSRYPRDVPNERPRSLRDFVEGQCVSWRRHAGGRSQSAIGDENGKQRVDHNGVLASRSWKGAKHKEDLQPGLDKEAVDGVVEGFPETLINLSNGVWEGDEFGAGFASELYTWTHFAAFDTSGPKPRGSLMVRYVDWRDAYEKYPTLPVFRPDTCTDLDKWERYMQRLRREKILTDTELYHPDSNGFDLDTFLKKMENDTSEDWNCCMPPPERSDGQAGPSDFLYVILVCSHPKGNFGKVLIEAAKRLQEKLGVRRLVLSALGHVVPFYFGQGFRPVSRSGRELTYVLERPARDTQIIKMQSKKTGEDIETVDIYNARLLTLDDFKDPKLKKAPKPPLPYYAVYDAARYDAKNAPANGTFDMEHSWGTDAAGPYRIPTKPSRSGGAWPYAEAGSRSANKRAADELLAAAGKAMPPKESPKRRAKAPLSGYASRG